MELRVQQASLTEIETPLLVVSVFEGDATPVGAAAAVDKHERRGAGTARFRLIQKVKFSCIPGMLERMAEIIHRGGRIGHMQSDYAVIASRTA